VSKKLLVSLLAASATLVSAQSKKALMIEPFDYSTVMTAVQSIFGTQQNIGTGIAAMLTTRVTQDGKFTMVERRKVANLTKEQDFAASNRVKQGTGARVGQIRGADLTLMGDIVVFGRDDRKVGGGAGAIVGGAGGVIGGSKSDAKAVVVIDYRLVDAETSEVVGSGEARGESKRTSKGFGAAMFAGGVGAGGGFNMTSSNFAETIIKLSQQIAAGPTTGSGGSRENDLDAIVADVDGANITINAGSAAGLAKGQTFTIYHKGKEIKDPKTGEVLDVQTTPIGTLTITNVRDRISTGTFAAAGGPAPVVGDVVRK
jgi:curli biogenesis system outer membrane secretion channel CsgG